MLQPLDELEKFYEDDDPWDFETTPDDAKRKSVILSELPKRDYSRVLDIGCGHGFVTRELPGDRIIGVDISHNAVDQANRFVESHSSRSLEFLQGSIFDLPTLQLEPFDLIIINGVLYSQYIGKSGLLVFDIVDSLLQEGGVLLTSHINEWYEYRFPFLTVSEYLFEYREYHQRIEVYVK
ncbi:class I SAM-dependent methyltransferase [Oscillatoria sp. CS-180]|uniref:class I SAM-dependent methyltransferase n=1 Tax=Oscillatoria sp. CS-180 TaxID=3021720 RepID=UPI00232AC0D9|nr:class I SAM-dependent methyltransferase [Oscillatoria sp. CS-180]MDB9527021.1 class I SAM-dependent methyltransferase [Oscillatoria sp. CS-180]